MTPDLDMLDRECAEIMGWTFDAPFPCLYGRDKEGQPGMGEICPRATRDPAAFLALLRWHTTAERCIHISADSSGAYCDLSEENTGRLLGTTPGGTDNPMVALALATSSWHRSHAPGGAT